MENENIRSFELFDLEQTLAADLLREATWPWDALPLIRQFILDIGPTLPASEYRQLADDIWVAKNADIAETACIHGPLIVGLESEIRHGAFIRGSVIVGNHCVVGNSTELKNSILFNNVQVPHYNYIGDSILGCKAHLGAGAITSNVKGDRSLVTLRMGDEKLDTGLKKFGAMIGDHVEIGCNTVLNPGSVIGRNTLVYPLTLIRGYIPGNSIVKQNGVVIHKSE